MDKAKKVETLDNIQVVNNAEVDEMLKSVKVIQQIENSECVDGIDYNDEFKSAIKESELPPVIKEIVENAPSNRKIHSFVASLAPLCALSPRVRLKYPFDSRESGLLLQVLVEGPQSSGKSFCSRINDLVMGNIIKKDQQQRRIEQEYRERKRKRKANEKLEDEPITTIRVIPANISKTVLVKRADYYARSLGDTLTFWMFSEELAQVVDAGRQGYSNLRTIMRTAYDLGALFGIDYQSETSYSAIVDINICSLLCCTRNALNKYMDKDSIEGGNVTRCVLVQIDDNIGADAAIFKPYTAEQLKSINRTIELLENNTFAEDGLLKPTINLDTSWLDKDIRSWCHEKGRKASHTGSIAMDVFRKRASVSAFRIAALCYYLYTLEGTDKAGYIKQCRKIYQFMADYILYMMLARWGERYETLNLQSTEKRMERKDKGLFFQLSDTFTRYQLKALIEENKLTTRSRQFIYTWTKNKDIVAIDKDTFKKVVR